MDNGKEQSVGAPQHRQEQPPVSTTLTTSSPTCYLNGEPLFTATTAGIDIRDPERKHRRMRPSSTIIADDWDDGALDLDDTELVRLEPGQEFTTSYTISAVPVADGLRNSDIRNNEITLRKRRWRWIFEDEMGEEMSEEERREVLRKKDVMEWSVDNMVTFKAA